MLRNDDDEVKCTVKTQSNEEAVFNGKDIEKTDDPLNIPLNLKKLMKTEELLNRKDIKEIINPSSLSDLQHEFMSCHNLLLHLPFRVMTKLATLGILPR